MKQTGERETFVVRILNTQNATWQGTVTWTDGKRMESFRSALELIRLIDSTLLEQGAPDVALQTSRKNFADKIQN